MKLTYRQIHKLLDKGVEMFVDSPTGKKKILNKFSKMSEGYIIKYDDGSETNCAIAHNMIFNDKLKSASEIQVGDIDYLSHKKVVSKTKIPEQEYLDFEISDPNGLYIQNGIIHHNSGKSLSISLILEFFRRSKKRGVLIVPNINLLTQFKSDIDSYGLKELSEQTLLLGNGHKSDFSTCLTITTWQSLMQYTDKLDKLAFDFIICDECHKFSSDCTSDILLKSMNTPIKLGFTGTLPDDPIDKMTLLGLFGQPQTIITASELIERGLGTPVNINAVILDYPRCDKEAFHEIPKDAYLKQLAFIKEYSSRTNLICKIAKSESSKSKNVLVLYQHTEHGESIFESLGLDKSKAYDYEYQKTSGVLFMNGSISGKIREEQRQYMESHTGLIMIANYACMSTGVSIKNLHSLILASPLKSFITISQSLGRLMRKHSSKTESNIFDIVDNFGFRKPSGIFFKQYKHRLESSYIPEEFNVKEITINLKK